MDKNQLNVTYLQYANADDFATIRERKKDLSNNNFNSTEERKKIFFKIVLSEKHWLFFDDKYLINIINICIKY